MATLRTLRLRPSIVSIVAQPGSAPWDNATNVLLEDNENAVIDMSAGIDGPKLQVLFTPVAEVIFPTWTVRGISARLRAACIGNTNPALSAPAVGLRIIPGDGNLYASSERIVPLQYLAAATDWITQGGPDDVWSIPDVYEVAKDAATVGLILEIDPKPWIARAATIEIDFAELVLHLEAEPLGDAILAPQAGLARAQSRRLTNYGEEPTGPIAPGSLVGNHLEGQMWFGAPDGTPVRMIIFRGAYSDARRYHTGEVIIVGNALYRALADKAAGAPFVGANWQAIS